jgi:RNA polymerase sigma factor FliA
MLADILEELSEKERLVIALYYYEELTQKEIAEVLGVSEGRISQLHSQALLKLRVKLINSDLYEP